MVLAVGAFAAMDAVGKWLTAEHDVMQMLAVRSTVAAVVLLALLPFFGGLESLRTRQPGAHALRSLCGLTSFVCFFVALRYLPLADATAVFFGGPFILSALAGPMLGEWVGPRGWVAIACGFMGMLLVVRPGMSGFQPAALLVIGASVSYALMMIMTRRMSRRAGARERSFAFVFYTLGGQALAAWLVVAWRFAPVDARSLASMGLMGLLGLGGQFAITFAFRKAPVAAVAPFEYTGLVWAVLLGYVVFGDFPDTMVWLGLAIIVVANLYTLLLDR